ncbi:hypothetical protein GPL17_07920 [Bradyrhizobium yuanmingense]|nr:hypothetical protein [Bradyrhizobium yuanmingense]
MTGCSRRRRATCACSNPSPGLQKQRSGDEAAPRRSSALKRDAIRMNRHRALGCCLSMIFSENRFTLFRIML